MSMIKVEPSDRKLYKCPLCFAMGFVHVGKPPSSPNQYFNRCIGRALTGEPSYVKYYFRDDTQPHWHAPIVDRTKTCGMEFTHPDGSLVEALPDAEYMQITKYPFSVKELHRLIIQRSEAKKLENQS